VQQVVSAAGTTSFFTLVSKKVAAFADFGTFNTLTFLSKTPQMRRAFHFMMHSISTNPPVAQRYE
jgi:hypothetical protein